MADRDSNRLPDLADRRRAATGFDANLIVLAGAGTGKTSLLVERMLTAVGSGRTKIERIAAVTFTEKAAGEMRERAALQLQRLWALARGEAEAGGTEADRAWDYLAGDAAVPASMVAQRSLEALEGLERATVETIHGFCSNLLRSYPEEAGVDPDFSVDAGEQAEITRRDVWEAFLAQELGAGAGRVELWRDLLSRCSLDAVERAAFALADFGIPLQFLQASNENTPAGELFVRDASLLADGLDTILNRPKGATDNALEYFRSTRAHLQRLFDDGLEGFIEGVRDDPGYLQRIRKGRLPTGFTRLESMSPEQAKRLTKETHLLVRDLLKIDERTVHRLIEAIEPFVRQFRDALLRRGFVTFDGLLSLARDLLRDRPVVRRQVNSRYDLLFVDEFQDTDPLQYEIVLLLAQSADDPENDPYRVQLEPGKLFIVGDAKQSIYRFRGADYSAYRRAVSRILDQGGEQLVLGANFRSVAGVVEPINRLFEESGGGCWVESSEQPPYQPIDAVRALEDDEPRTEVWTLAGDGAVRADERRHGEGEVIASEIERLVEQAQVRYGEISVLFRSFTSLGHYIRPLRERDIPFVVDGGREFLERPEVAHLIGTLHALAQPADHTALLAYLRSPAGAVSDAELAAHGASGGRWDWRAESEGDPPTPVERAFGRLRALAERTRDLPADAVIRGVLEETLLLPLNAAAFEGSQRVANLRKLAGAAGELARDGRLSLEEVVEALQEGRVTEIESDAPLADDSVDAVRISTIHRMKGLENSWVFLPDLARGNPRGSRDRVQARAVLGPAGEMLALRLDDLSNSAALWWDRDNARHEAAEEVRVLYVALTRARDRLVLVAGPTRRKAPWMEALRPWGLDFSDPPEDGARVCGGRVLHRIVEPRKVRQSPRRTRLTSTEEAERNHEIATRRLDSARPPLASPSGLREEMNRGAEDAPLTDTPARSRDVNRAAGIVVHRWLEHRRGESRTGALARLGDLCREVAEHEGVVKVELELETRSIVDGFLDSDLAAHFDRIEILGRELPILVQADDGGVFGGSIDLLYRDPQGRIVVVDYKTDRETDAQRLFESYGRQLAVYADAVQHALGLDSSPRTEIWALRTGSILTKPPRTGHRGIPGDQ